MSHRPLAIVSGLAIGDYLLWNWSLNANHAVLSLISGLTLPPLVIAFLWLLALSVARVLARSTRPGVQSSRGAADARRRRDRSADAAHAASGSSEQSPNSSGTGAASPGSSRKLAA